MFGLAAKPLIAVSGGLDSAWRLSFRWLMVKPSKAQWKLLVSKLPGLSLKAKLLVLEATSSSSTFIKNTFKLTSIRWGDQENIFRLEWQNIISLNTIFVYHFSGSFRACDCASQKGISQWINGGGSKPPGTSIWLCDLLLTLQLLGMLIFWNEVIAKRWCIFDDSKLLIGGNVNGCLSLCILLWLFE